MARKFLYGIAIIIVLILAAGIAYKLFPDFFLRQAFVPSEAFVEQGDVAANTYADPDMWFVHPGKSDDPADWMPAGFGDRPAAADDSGDLPGNETAIATTDYADSGTVGDAAIFFVHPTSYLDRAHWNASLDDATANTRARQFIRGEASAFNHAGQIWAPRYRQATLGAFLSDGATAQRALDAAYRDVAAAFNQFLKDNPDGPIILAGHSQGSLHLTTLLKDKIAGTPIADRIVAAYIIGWPISVDHDLAALGLPACAGPTSTRCIVSWQSYGEPADPSLVQSAYDNTTGFDGKPRKDSRMLCTNPLTGTPDSTADAAANLGTVVPDADFNDGSITVGAVAARCDDDRGFLLIGDPPELGGYVLPGNNYHVFDYPLFWVNARADVARRLAAFAA